MDKLPKDNHDSIDATWLMEEPYLDIIPEDPLKKPKSFTANARSPRVFIRKATILATG